MRKENKVKVEITDESISLTVAGCPCGVRRIHLEQTALGVQFYVEVDSMNVYQHLVKNGARDAGRRVKGVWLPASLVCFSQVAFRRANRIRNAENPNQGKLFSKEVA